MQLLQYKRDMIDGRFIKQTAREAEEVNGTVLLKKEKVHYDCKHRNTYWMPSNKGRL